MSDPDLEPTGIQTDAPAPPPSYEHAGARIEEIIRRLDSGEAGLRETLELVREGRGLVEFCARELREVGEGLEQLHLDELVAQLARDASSEPAEGEQPGGP
jgi:exodeoxyribonuclease VII small subunit